MTNPVEDLRAAYEAHYARVEASKVPITKRGADVVAARNAMYKAAGIKWGFNERIYIHQWYAPVFQHDRASVLRDSKERWGVRALSPSRDDVCFIPARFFAEDYAEVIQKELEDDLAKIAASRAVREKQEATRLEGRRRIFAGELS